MHQGDFDINLDEITKIEGDAGLEVAVRNNRVESVKFKIQDALSNIRIHEITYTT